VTPGAWAARRAPVTEPPPDPDALLRALAEPQRRRIVQLVGDGELPAGAIADQFAITPQAVSQHLRVLKDAGLLRERRDGTRRLYALRPEAIASVQAFPRRPVAVVAGPPARRRPGRREVSDDALTTSLRIAAAPDAVFPYLTDPKLLVRWMGDWADLVPEPGGTYAVDIGGVPVRGLVEVDPPRRVVFTWGVAGRDDLPVGGSTVEITLRPDGAAAVVELVHRDLPPEERPKHAAGWDHLPRLATAAGGGDPGPDPWATA